MLRVSGIYTLNFVLIARFYHCVLQTVLISATDYIIRDRFSYLLMIFPRQQEITSHNIVHEPAKLSCSNIFYLF